MKNLLNSVMLFLLLFVAQNAWCTIVASGDLTSTITWKVEKLSGVSKLTVSGTGEMPDYTSFTAVPWADLRNTISILEIGDGITRIGNRAFNSIATTKVSIPSSCKTIGIFAFNGCKKMTDIYIPANVTSISTNAVNNCSKLKFVHYDGRCTSSTVLNLATCAETGRFIEKSGTGDSYADVPEGWEYYTHAEKCQGGAWVAENADQTKLFFYAQSSGAKVDYASTVVLSENDQDATNHPWRLNCYKYTSLEIDKNIAAIGEDELRGYVNRDVTKMGYINMQTITVQSGNSYFVVGEDGALYDKSKTTVYLYPAKSTATNIEIPATVTTIRPGAFYGAENIQKIDFLGTISTIGAYAFAQTSSLSYLGFASETAPTSTATTAFTGVARGGVVAASVETNAFKTFTSNIGYGWTFAGETYGPVKSYISNGTLYVVGKGAYTTECSYASWYDQRSSIKKIVVKGGITNIRSFAFEDCSNVTEVTLNNSGTIDYYAFKDCVALTRVNIGANVKELESYYYEGKDSHYPFEGCSNLSQINIADFASFNNIGNLGYLTDSKFGTCEEKILMINGKAISYTDELVIPEGIKKIDKNAIRFFENITKIIIPESVSKIEDGNFAGSYLREITVPSTVGYVGYSAFEGCTSLRTATLSNSGSIGSEAFKDCTSLQTVILNNGGGIDSYVFEGCTSLQSATLNNGGNIGASAFEGCTSLQSATLNNGGAIRYHAFKDCVALTRVNIGANVKELEYYEGKDSHYPFEGCSKLAIVNITDFKSYCSIDGIKYLIDSEYGTAASKTLMVNGAVYDSTIEIDIPEGITSIKESIFRGFTNLTKVKIPSTVTSVGSAAFCDCPNLKRIVCLTPKCPTTAYNDIATSPKNITLRVRGGTASQYKVASSWKDFNIEEGKLESENIDMKTNDLATLTIPTKAVSWSISGESIASLTDDFASDGISRFVSSGDFVYDATIEEPYKTVTVTADLDNCDVYVFNIKVYPREVVLTDGNAYKNTVDFEAEKISYTRSFSSNVKGHWQCFYVPFDIEITDELLDEFEFAKLYMVSYYDSNGNGVIEDGEPLKMILSRFSAGTILHANKPYYVKPKNACTKTFESTNVVLKAAANGSVRCCTTEHEYTLVGINETTNIKGMYSMNTKGQFVYCTSDANIKANRWYMEVKSLTEDGAVYENYARPIQIVIDGEDEETTGIANLDDKASAPQNDKVFTLDGRQVNNTDNLPSGMYIVNGKKVVKK